MRLRPLRRAARTVVKAVARRLPPARGRALAVGAQALFTLLTGRPTRATRVPLAAKPAGRAVERGAATSGAKEPLAKASEPTKAKAAGGVVSEPLTDAQRDELKRAEWDIELGHRADAARRLSHLGMELPTNLRVRQLQAATVAGGGDSREHALALHRVHALRDDPDVRRRERSAAGHVVVTSPGWLPRIPGAPLPMRPADEVAVLFLADESLPYSSTPSTARLRQRLAEAVAASARPAVVTGLGFPRSAGVADAPAVEVHDGIPHHRLDPGPFYALDGPADRRLRDAAWLAAGVAARVRPGLLHVIAAGGPDVALIGAALRTHLGVPMVIEVVVDPGAADTEDAGRLQDTLTRGLRAAEVVIVADAATRDRVVGRGVDHAHVTVLAARGDAGGAHPDGGIAAVYARAMAGRGAEAGA